ncbi:hypothetical protein [Xenorhabdus entomophaga]|uniref:hypothetical protein n=1 Tax=Xenorhabdus entomophaga TaxID=3136257 RepID=UPI0030F42122
MSDIFLAEYQGGHDERCEAFNDAVKLLTDIKTHRTHLSWDLLYTDRGVARNG